MPGVTEQFFAMVLDYYRAPQSHPASVDATTPVPGEFSAFLDYLTRPEERLAPVAHKLGCRTDELLAASYFYIRQLLFPDGCNHYCVLGLPANADNNEIRRRYRLLISLFHPDRSGTKEHWEEQFVRCLNRAYGVLKRPEKRRAYDQELGRTTQGSKAAGKKRRHGQPAGWKVSPRVIPRSASPLELPYRFRFLQRYPKIVIWLVILLLLGAVLLLISLGGSGNTTLTLAKPERAGESVADRVPPSLFSSADVWTGAAPEVVKESLPEIEMIEPKAAQQPDSKVASQEAVVERSTPVPARQSSAASHEQPGVEPAAPATMANLPYTGFDGAEIAASSAIERPNRNLQRRAGARNGGETLPWLQPEYVFMQYVRAYEAADLNKLLSLFTLEPSTNPGQGRNLIRSGYASVFQQTRHRKIDVEQVTIRQLGNTAYQLKASLQVVNEAKNGNKTRFHGEMVLQLIRKGKKLYIASLLHNVANTQEAP